MLAIERIRFYNGYLFSKSSIGRKKKFDLNIEETYLP